MHRFYLLILAILLSLIGFSQVNFQHESFFSQLKPELKEKENFKLGYSFDSQLENQIFYPNIYHFSKISMRYASDKLKNKNIEFGLVITPLFYNNRNSKISKIHPVTVIAEPQNEIYKGISAGFTLMGRNNISNNSYIEGGVLFKTNNYNRECYSVNKNSKYGYELMFLLKSKNIGVQSHLILNFLINPININGFGVYILEDLFFSNALITNLFIENKPNAELFFRPYLSFISTSCFYFDSAIKKAESKPGYNLFFGLYTKIRKSEIFFEYGETVLNSNIKNGFFGMESNFYTSSYYHTFNKIKLGMSVSYNVRYYLDYRFVLENRSVLFNSSIIYSL